MTYTQNIPDGPNNPSQDQPLMKANTNAIFTLIGTDHINFNLPNSGYHNVIRQPPIPSMPPDPAMIAGINQLYAKNVTPDATVTAAETQLFSITGSGKISQLTGRFTSGSEGYVWSGGILFQWGFSSSLTTTITFKTRAVGCIPFPNNIFNVIIGLSDTGAGVAGGDVVTVSAYNLTLTSFQSIRRGANLTTDGFYWLAIGK
jgi:hypothetical protein